MTFSGFETPRDLTAIPGQFFSELLARIDHLGELKLSLYAIWRHERQSSSRPYFRRVDLAADSIFMSGLGSAHEEQERVLDEALSRAAERGTLLQVAVDGGEALYLLNSPKGRAAAQALQQGSRAPEDETGPRIELTAERPNIFQLYESNIGPLTPMLAETLRDAEAEYPGDWIEDAVQIALENNVRKWSYVDAILRSWQEKGRDDRKNKQESEKDRRKYVQGEFSDYIES